MGAADDLPEAKAVRLRIETKISPNKDTVAQVVVTDRTEPALADDDMRVETICAEDVTAFRHPRGDRRGEADRAHEVVRLMGDDGKHNFKGGARTRMMAVRIQSVVQRVLEVRAVRKLRELSAVHVNKLHVPGDIQ
jgi:hypothetical protein